MRLYEVGERLYVSAFPKDRDLDGLHAAGIDTVFTFSKKRLPESVKDHFEVVYMHLPDGKYPDLWSIHSAVFAVEEELSKGRTCLLHCLAGRNRSAMVAALVEARRHGWHGHEALSHIRTVRPKAIHNPAFERVILESYKEA